MEEDNNDFFPDCVENAAKHIQPVRRPFPGVSIPIYPWIYYHNECPFDRNKSFTLDLSKFPHELRDLHIGRITAFDGDLVPRSDMKEHENYGSDFVYYNLVDSLGSKTLNTENGYYYYNDDEIIEVYRNVEDNDSDIVAMSDIVCLNCPLRHKKVQLPMKGVNCSHLQCFDHTAYMIMNMKRPEWKCPICRKPASYQDLRINRLLLEMIVGTPSECTKVQLNRDGSWTPVI